MAKEEEMGYHKGALEALLNERGELARLSNIVDSLIQIHSNSLQKMGVDVEKFIENVRNKKEKNRKRARKKQKDGDKLDISNEDLPEEL